MYKRERERTERKEMERPNKIGASLIKKQILKIKKEETKKKFNLNQI